MTEQVDLKTAKDRFRQFLDELALESSFQNSELYGTDRVPKVLGLPFAAIVRRFVFENPDCKDHQTELEGDTEFNRRQLSEEKWSRRVG